jgi:long-chain acyl-CoA synthetase
LYRGLPPTIAPKTETALEMFRATAARDPGAPLAHYFERSLTFTECDRLSDALAVALQRRGVESGDRIAIYLQNIPQVLIGVLAAWKCGAVVVPYYPERVRRAQ